MILRRKGWFLIISLIAFLIDPILPERPSISPIVFFFQSFPLELGISFFLGSIATDCLNANAKDLKQLSIMW